MIDRFFTVPEKSFFLFGPRGTGKTTLLKKVVPDAMWIDLLRPDVFYSYNAEPERLREMVMSYPEGKIFVIDEIQKIPQLLTMVHELIEQKKNWRFILTGSSARKLKRDGADLLAGRAVVRRLHPFMASELKEQFHVEQALECGMIPLIQQSPDPRDSQNAYVGMYIKEEVQQEGIVRKIENFSRFLKTMSFSQASVLTIANIARESKIHRKVLEGYLEILEDILLGFRLDVFSKKAKRALISHPKFYYFDCGVYNALRPKGPLDEPAEIQGHALETLVAQHLRAWCDYSDFACKTELYFWRTKFGNEVDFIVYGEKEFVAIEVKHSMHIHPKDLNGLRAFSEDYPQATCIVLYRGKERLQKGNILCCPVEDFLLRLVPDRLIEEIVA